MVKKILILTINFFILSVSLICQNQALPTKILDQSKGLSNGFNMHFQTDKDGFFWTSSRYGLNRFDGKEVKVYLPKYDEKSIDLNITSNVFQDDKNNRWFTSSSALHCILSGTDSIQTWRLASNSATSYYYAFHLEQDHVLWVVANKQLYAIDIHLPIEAAKSILKLDTYLAYAIEDKSAKVVQIVTPPTTKDNHAIEILDRKDSLSFSKRYIEIIPKNKADNNPSIFFIEIESPNSFWIPSNIGLIHIDPSMPEQYKVFKHKEEKAVFYADVASWKDSYLWITDPSDGLLLFDKTSKEFIRQDSLFLINGKIQKLNGIYKAHLDEYENLWFSILGQGLFYTNLSNIKFDQLFPLSSLESLNKVAVKTILETQDHQILCQLENENVYALSPNQVNDNLNPIPALSSLNSKSIDTYNGNEVWLSTTKGIALWKKDQLIQEIELPEATNALQVITLNENELLVLTNSKLFLITISVSAVDFKGIIKQEINVDLPVKLFYDTFSQMVFLSQDDNFLRTFKFDVFLSEKEKLKNIGIVNSIFKKNQKDLIWLASSTGLYLYDPRMNKAEKIIGPESQLDQAFSAVVEDSLDQVWLSSFNGIYKYQPSNNYIDHFTQSDGLTSMQYNENSVLYADNGKIYFGGNKGVTSIDPKLISINQNTPNIQLIEFKVNNDLSEKTSLMHPIKAKVFNHDQNTLSFKFALLEFSDPTLNELKYYLIKGKNDTILIGNTNPVQFSLLSPGKYQLEVYAGNSDGIWSQESKSFFFTILPPWYLTWWAKSLGLIILILIIYYIYRLRIKQIEKRESFKRKEAEFKQLVAETETAVLRLQMNPHFIFNSMNSISSFILKKDMKTANNYLHRFAKLMRIILENSEQEFVDLTEETEFLKQYLDIEILRLGKQLNYQFEVNSNIDPDEVLLPTMILQPFVENAIWHGISPKAGIGHIIIRFKINGKELICEVEDNGVGRAFHTKVSLSHPSKAILITRRRLDLLKQRNNSNSKLTIIDLFDEQGIASGTKVQLTLPLID